MEVIEVVGQTTAKVIPVTIALALVFTVLSHFRACDPGKPWWRKRELITDICYWFFVPVFARIRSNTCLPRRCSTAGITPRLKRAAITLWDILFGTFRMPENRLPGNYGVDDQEIPAEIGGQLAYPFRH
jgi:hypothetical protein